MSPPAPHAAPAAPAPLPAADIIVLENVTWADYQRLLEIYPPIGYRPVCDTSNIDLEGSQTAFDATRRRALQSERRGSGVAGRLWSVPDDTS